MCLPFCDYLWPETNVLGTFLGVVIVVGRYNVKPQFTATRRIGTVAAALALLLILGVWKMSGNWPSDRERQLPEPGPWTRTGHSTKAGAELPWTYLGTA